MTFGSWCNARRKEVSRRRSTLTSRSVRSGASAASVHSRSQRQPSQAHNRQESTLAAEGSVPELREGAELSEASTTFSVPPSSVSSLHSPSSGSTPFRFSSIFSFSTWNGRTILGSVFADQQCSRNKYCKLRALFAKHDVVGLQGSHGGPGDIVQCKKDCKSQVPTGSFCSTANAGGVMFATNVLGVCSVSPWRGLGALSGCSVFVVCLTGVKVKPRGILNACVVLYRLPPLPLPTSLVTSTSRHWGHDARRIVRERDVSFGRLDRG
eukprot:1904390-Pyramimonas_sp.AAC.1